MKGLTAEQYGALRTLDSLTARGMLVWAAGSPDAQALITRGLVASEPRECRACGCMHAAATITSAGRTAMRCYELEHRPLDLSDVGWS